MTYALVLAAGIALGFLLFAIISLAKKSNKSKQLPKLWEADAESFLGKNGFNILEKQKSAPIITFIDGKSHLSTASADYIVQKNNIRYAVKVAQEQEAAPHDEQNIKSLVELSVLFPDYNLLFLNINKGGIHEVSFEFPKTRGGLAPAIFVAISVIIIIISILFLLVQLKLF